MYRASLSLGCHVLATFVSSVYSSRVMYLSDVLHIMQLYLTSITEEYVPKIKHRNSIDLDMLKRLVKSHCLSIHSSPGQNGCHSSFTIATSP